MPALTIDLDQHPDRAFRIDAFAVPAAARGEFEAAMRRSLTFLDTLPGFLGHVAFERAGGPSAFNIVTIAVWESRGALENAGTQVRAYYQSIGFDLPAALMSWGVRAEQGIYEPFPSPAA
jgi:heme-degrading monooxygenase HmoA